MFEGCVIEWNEEKNLALKRERGLAFEGVLAALSSGGYVADLEHTNPERYPNQRIVVVQIDGYACAVPYVREGNRVFLKTIYRSRKLRAEYGEEL